LGDNKRKPQGVGMRLFILGIFLFASISGAQANDTGCGLGSLIWKQNSIVSAVFAITTNHSFSSQLFGITTGTSGCSQHSIVKREMYPIYYAEANLPELRHEMAMGQGEYLATFAQVLGCTPETKVKFMKWAQGSYTKMFSDDSTTYDQMLKGLGREFKATHLSASCDNLALI
jgi:hypothetical protein